MKTGNCPDPQWALVVPLPSITAGANGGRNEPSDADVLAAEMDAFTALAERGLDFWRDEGEDIYED